MTCFSVVFFCAREMMGVSVRLDWYGAGAF